VTQISVAPPSFPLFLCLPPPDPDLLFFVPLLLSITITAFGVPLSILFPPGFRHPRRLRGLFLCSDPRPFATSLRFLSTLLAAGLFAPRNVFAFGGLAGNPASSPFTGESRIGCFLWPSYPPCREWFFFFHATWQFCLPVHLCALALPSPPLLAEPSVASPIRRFLVARVPSCLPDFFFFSTHVGRFLFSSPIFIGTAPSLPPLGILFFREASWFASSPVRGPSLFSLFLLFDLGLRGLSLTPNFFPHTVAVRVPLCF